MKNPTRALVALILTIFGIGFFGLLIALASLYLEQTLLVCSFVAVMVIIGGTFWAIYKILEPREPNGKG